MGNSSAQVAERKIPGFYWLIQKSEIYMDSKIILTVSSVLSAFALVTSTAHAACTMDRTGTVYCSRFAGGGAELSREGTGVCGRGECARNKFGQFECSMEVGGGAARNRWGLVRCLGGCEVASDKLCEEGK